MIRIIFILAIIAIGSITTSYAQGNTPGYKIMTMPDIAFTNGNIKANDFDKTFNTYNNIHYNELKAVIVALEKRRKDYIDDQAALSRKTPVVFADGGETEDPAPKPEDVIAAKEAHLKTIKAEIAKIDKQLTPLIKQRDSVYQEYTVDYLQHKRFFLFNFGAERSRAFFDLVYNHKGNKFKALSTGGVNFGNESATVFSELVSGNLGAFRVSFGSVISNSSDENQEDERSEEAFQKLAANGGNTVLNLEYPLSYIHSRDNQYNFLSKLSVRGTGDFPAFGTSTDKFAGSLMAGVNFYADASTSNGAIRFFTSLTLNRIKGSDEYIQNLAISRSAFNFGQLSAGLVFLNSIKLSFIIGTYSSEKSLRNHTVIAGGQVLN